jgi:hypothetical protein
MPERFKCYRRHYDGVQSTIEEFEELRPQLIDLLAAQSMQMQKLEA